MITNATRENATSRRPAYPVAFAACALLAGVMLWGNVMSWRDWPGNPPLFSTGDSYSEVAARGGNSAINVRIALAVRGAVNIADMGMMLFPKDMSIVNIPLESWGDETRQVVSAGFVGDLLLGKVERQPYDPSIPTAVVDELLQRGDLREYSTHIVITTHELPPGGFLRLFRDVEGERFVVLPADFDWRADIR